MSDVYARLAKHLDTLPIPYPPTESGIELKILERWFTPEEAEIALAMTGLPEPVSAIAGRLNRPAGSLFPVLEAMTQRGLIFRVAKGDQRFYNIVPLAEGMWEFHLNLSPPEELKMLHEYLEFFMEKGWYGTRTTQHRIIPISKSIPAQIEITSYEQAEEIIKAQTKISVAPCICRKEQQMMGEGCAHLSEVCMAFGTGAFFYIDSDLGREISSAEALDILHKAMEDGLVLQPGNGQKVWGFCMCCGCCCSLLKALKKFESPASVAHTNFFAQVNTDNCSACGLCADRCPMEAITLDIAALINRERCIGCGVCVGACEFQGVALRQKEAKDRYIPPVDVLDMKIRIARERGLL
jgi:Na+-translocating ferredoxin:NAD+ oxidoreductase subunit B